jgi:hypothetical protein
MRPLSLGAFRPTTPLQLILKGLLSLAMSTLGWSQVSITAPSTPSLSFGTGAGTPSVLKLEATRPEFVQIRPFAAVLNNASPIAVRGISIHWEWTDGSGNKHTNDQRSDSYYLEGRDVLGSGSSLIVYPGAMMWDQSTPHVSGGALDPGRIAQSLVGATGISATLDAAILADGTLVGPDEHHFVRTLTERKKVAREVATMILNVPPQNLKNVLTTYKTGSISDMTISASELNWRNRLVREVLGTREDLTTIANKLLNLPPINVN